MTATYSRRFWGHKPSASAVPVKKPVEDARISEGMEFRSPRDEKEMMAVLNILSILNSRNVAPVEVLISTNTEKLGFKFLGQPDSFLLYQFAPFLSRGADIKALSDMGLFFDITRAEPVLALSTSNELAPELADKTPLERLANRHLRPQKSLGRD